MNEVGTAVETEVAADPCGPRSGCRSGGRGTRPACRCATSPTRCGLSQPFVSAVERGMSTPSIATLYRMAEVLETEPSALLAEPAERRRRGHPGGRGRAGAVERPARVRRRSGAARRPRSPPRDLRVPGRARRRPRRLVRASRQRRAAPDRRGGCSSSSPDSRRSSSAPATASCTPGRSRTAGPCSAPNTFGCSS